MNNMNDSYLDMDCEIYYNINYEIGSIIRNIENGNKYQIL